MSTCARHRWAIPLPAIAEQHRDGKTLEPLVGWGILTRQRCANCPAIRSRQAKLRYYATSRREAWDAFRPEA